MIKVLENNLCKINYAESLKPLAEQTILLLNKKIKEYENFFKIKLNKKVIVNYFDNLDEFRNFIYSLRKEQNSLPSYAEATYDDEMINAYINADNQNERLYTASHELFHIFYQKYILKDNYNKRITWYDEGMAQYMSGEKDNINLENFYSQVKKETKVIPNLNKLDHGLSFLNKDYNGYNLSYLAIRYLSEILSKKEFKELMSNFSLIKKLGNNKLQEVFDYYDLKFNL